MEVTEDKTRNVPEGLDLDVLSGKDVDIEDAEVVESSLDITGGDTETVVLSSESGLQTGITADIAVSEMQTEAVTLGDGDMTFEENGMEVLEIATFAGSGIRRITQPVVAAGDGEANRITFELTRGDTFDVFIKNGSQGGTGGHDIFVMSIDQSLGGFMAPGETEEVSVKVRNGFGLDVTERFGRITVKRDSGDRASDLLWDAGHENVGNPFPIGFADLGIDGIRRTVATFHVTATDEGQDVQVHESFDFYT